MFTVRVEVHLVHYNFVGSIRIQQSKDGLSEFCSLSPYTHSSHGCLCFSSAMITTMSISMR